MNDEQTFLAAIRAGDDVARLAYADWLEERGDPRAEWVRDRLLFRWMPHGTDDPLPALLEAMPYRHHDADFALALQRLGPRVAPALWDRLLQATGEHQRQTLERCLSRMPADAIRPFKPQLLEWLHSDNAEDQEIALNILCTLGPEIADIVPRLLELLPTPSDTNGVLRNSQTLRLLGRIGPAAVVAADALVEHLPFDQDDHFTAVREALRGIGPGVVPALVRAMPAWQGNTLSCVVALARSFDLADLEQQGVLDHPDPPVRTPFLLGCLERRPALLDELPALVGTLRQHPALVEPLLESLRPLGAQAAAAIPVLRQLLDLAPTEIATLLRDLDPERLRDEARAQLDHPDALIRARAIRTLHGLEDFDANTLDRVEALLEDHDDAVLHAALVYLHEQPVRDEARLSRRLAPLLRAPRAPWLSSVRFWFHNLGLPSLQPVILELLDSEVEECPETAIWWLRQGFSVDPEALVQTLIRGLENTDHTPRRLPDMLAGQPQAAEHLWPWLRQYLRTAPVEVALRRACLLEAMPDTPERTEVTLRLLGRARDAQIPFDWFEHQVLTRVLREAALSEETFELGESLADWLWHWACCSSNHFHGVAWILARHTHSGPHWLVQEFDNADQRIATAAISSLREAAMLQPEILAALRARLRHPDDGHRCCAVLALGSRATWEDLVPLIEDRNDNVYRTVFCELARRGDDPRIWPHLLTLANDDSTPLRREIVQQARHHLPPEQARAWLQSRLEHETDEYLVTTIQRELEVVENPPEEITS